MSCNLRCFKALCKSLDIYQRKTDQTYDNCKGAVGTADGVKVFGYNETKHYDLWEIIKCTRSTGIKLNFDKCNIKTNSCNLFGYLYTGDGVRSDPRKADANTQ